LICEVSLKTSICAKQAQFKNPKSKIKVQKSKVCLAAAAPRRYGGVPSPDPRPLTPNPTRHPQIHHPDHPDRRTWIG
jgi:hypothetical protein